MQGSAPTRGFRRGPLAGTCRLHSWLAKASVLRAELTLSVAQSPLRPPTRTCGCAAGAMWAQRQAVRPSRCEARARGGAGECVVASPGDLRGCLGAERCAAVGTGERRRGERKGRKRKAEEDGEPRPVKARV
eukprot:scaffold8942_cov99-Isochrysis_galbana.AAC.3